MTRTDKVLLIYTGGTIGMGINPNSKALEPLDFSELVRRMPEFNYIETDIDVMQFPDPIDSSDMDIKDWARLVGIIAENYERYDGFVVLHGTDTMAYTASALSFMLENLTKPVILTGSQLPVGQLRTDGKENLMTSIELAAAHHPDGTACVPEVCIYFSGKLLRGNRSTKRSADGFNAFSSFNYPHLCDAGVNIVFHDHDILKPDYSSPMVPHVEMGSSVAVFSLFPGIREDVVKYLLEEGAPRAIVMRTFGSGNAPRKEWFTRLLKDATDRGVVIVNISQCVAGHVEMGRYETGYSLQQAGVTSGYDSTVEAAITKLMFLQARTDDPEEIRRVMNHSIAGEISERL